MFADKPVRDLLAAFASPAAMPGGGSATAVASAVGASLLQMVCALPKTRSGSEADRTALAAAATALGPVQAELTEAIDADIAAYTAVVAAYKRSKAPDAEREAGQIAIQRALQRATDVPLGIMRLSAAGLKHAETVAEHGYARAAGEVGVAVALLRAGLQGARLIVEINLDRLHDATYKARVAEEIARRAADAEQAAGRAERSVATAARIGG